MKASLNRALVFALLAGTALTASAVDSVALEYGVGNRTDVVRLSGQWNWAKPVWAGAERQVTGHWDVNLSAWQQNRYQNLVGQDKNFWTAGVTPVFRLQGKGTSGTFAEAGLGVHYFSDLYDNNGSQLSTRYQFGTLLGVGHRYANGLELGVRIQHFSNGGFKQPNTGVNLALVRAGWKF